jgi:hypothetical protein
VAVLRGYKFVYGWKTTKILLASCRLLSAIANKRSIIISDVSKATN